MFRNIKNLNIVEGIFHVYNLCISQSDWSYYLMSLLSSALLGRMLIME